MRSISSVGPGPTAGNDGETGALAACTCTRSARSRPTRQQLSCAERASPSATRVDCGACVASCSRMRSQAAPGSPSIVSSCAADRPGSAPSRRIAARLQKLRLPMSSNSSSGSSTPSSSVASAAREGSSADGGSTDCGCIDMGRGTRATPAIIAQATSSSWRTATSARSSARLTSATESISTSAASRMSNSDSRSTARTTSK